MLGARLTSSAVLLAKYSQDELSYLFMISISAFGQHIQSKVSLEYLERHLPRRYLRTAIDQDSLRGKEVSGTIDVSAFDWLPGSLTFE